MNSRYSCDDGLRRLLPWMVLSDFVAIGCFFIDFCWYVKVSTLVLIFIIVSFDLDPGVVTLFILIYNKFLNCSDRVYIVSRVVFWYETFWWVWFCTYPLELPIFICCGWLYIYEKYTFRGSLYFTKLFSSYMYW